MSIHDKQPTLDQMGDYIAAASQRQVPRTNLLGIIGWHGPVEEEHREVSGVFRDRVVYRVPQSADKVRTFELSSDTEGGRRIKWSDMPGDYVYSGVTGWGVEGMKMLWVRGSEAIYEPKPERYAHHLEAGRIAVEGADGWFASAVADDITTTRALYELSDWREAKASRGSEVTDAHDGVITPPRVQTVGEARERLDAMHAKDARLRIGEALGQVAAYAGIQVPEEWLDNRPADPAAS